MRITGTFTFDAPPERVWEVLLDPHALAGCIPGCSALQRTGDGEYAATITVGIAAFKGTYHGTVRVSDAIAPECFTLGVEGTGRPGFVKGIGRIQLAAEGKHATRVEVEGDAQVGGPVLSVASRLIVPTAKMLMNQFFNAMQQEVRRRAEATA
jgi:carbon monoxide dehydrogenase subunit G